MMARFGWLVFLLTAPSAFGCEEELGAAFADMRAAAPDICTEFCMEKVDCEWPTTEGQESEEAYSAAIRKCIFTCAFYADSGAYVSEVSAASDVAKSYPSHVDGDALTTALGCLYDLGAYRCTPGTQFMFLLSPVSQSKCEQAQSCLSDLDADLRFVWRVEKGGPCEQMGGQSLEAPYF